MHTTRNIEYPEATRYFSEAEIRGNKLILGDMNTNFWLHKEKINFDYVVEIAKRFNDSRIFIIPEGINKGFYIYSPSRKVCFKLVNETSIYSHAEIA